MLRKLFCLLFALPFIGFGQTEVFSEDFESGIPAGWTIIDNDGHTVNASVSEFQPAWISTSDPENAMNTVAGSTSFFEPEARASRWLITPSIVIGDFGNFLNWRAMSQDPSFPDWYMVLVSTTGTEVADFTDTLFRIVNEFPQWTEREVNLSDSGYNNVTIHLAFVNNTNRGFKLYVDDVSVTVNDPVSVMENELVTFNVFPNPASDFISINSQEEILQVKIIDASGKEVHFDKDNLDKINVQNLEQGIYFIQISTTKGFSTQKFIKN